MFFAGALDCPGGTGVNHYATGVSGAAAFSLPASMQRLFLVADQTGVQWEMTTATGISFFTSAARGAYLAGTGVMNGPYDCITGAQTTVSVFSLGNSTRVRVFKAPGV
jgi:hypothetical protein